MAITSEFSIFTLPNLSVVNATLLSAGVVCVVVGFVIFLLDWLASDNLATFFGDDIANQFEEAYYGK